VVGVPPADLAGADVGAPAGACPGTAAGVDVVVDSSPTGDAVVVVDASEASTCGAFAPWSEPCEQAPSNITRAKRTEGALRVITPLSSL
jgi:hypothetical protein